ATTCTRTCERASKRLRESSASARSASRSSSRATCATDGAASMTRQYAPVGGGARLFGPERGRERECEKLRGRGSHRDDGGGGGPSGARRGPVQARRSRRAARQGGLRARRVPSLLGRSLAKRAHA